MPCSVGGDAIYAQGVLAAERGAAVARVLAIGVDRRLASGQPGMMRRPAADEQAAAVDENVGVRVRVHRLVAKHRLHNGRVQVVAHGFEVGALSVARGQTEAVDAAGLSVAVLDAHLGLAVGLQVIDCAAAADLVQAPGELVREQQR